MMRRSIVQGERSFTLVELVVAMGVIAVVGALTLVAVRQVARDTRQASGVNAVMASLDNARALAMKENKIVLVVFRPRFDGPQKMFVECVLAEWTGDTAQITNGCVSPNANPTIVDRFVPIQDIVPRRLPAGIKVAGPQYGTSIDDNSWLTQANLPTINQVTGSGEPSGQLIAVMYGPDGATVSRNSQTDSHRMFVDFNSDKMQNFRNHDYSYVGNDTPPCDAQHFEQLFAPEETMVSIAPFISVYDDDEARKLARGTWQGGGTGAANYFADLTGPIGYITNRSDRIHFNRYSGVAMK